MTVTEALQLIEKNEHVPALNYAVAYTYEALNILEHFGPNSNDFKTQILYILNNITRWRQSKTSTTTAAEIKECRAVLKKASQ